MDYKNQKEVRARGQRTLYPVNYYIIDFEFSRKYNPEDGPPRETEYINGDKTIPEFNIEERGPYDPFPVDVYCAGNIVRKDFLQVCRHPIFVHSQYIDADS